MFVAPVVNAPGDAEDDDRTIHEGEYGWGSSGPHRLWLFGRRRSRGTNIGRTADVHGLTVIVAADVAVAGYALRRSHVDMQ